MEIRQTPSSAPYEIDLLRQSLQEAEDVCRAIRAGEVDAMVVGTGDDAKRVLMMSGAYARYRQVVEDMEQGAVTVASGGEILFANHGFAAMLKRNVIDLFRAPLSRHIREEDHPALLTLLEARLGTRDIEVHLSDAAGSPVRMSLVSSSDDFTTILITDLSERRELEEAKATMEAIRRGMVDAFVVGGEKIAVLDSFQETFRRFVEQMQEGAVTLTDEGVVDYANERFAALLRAPLSHVLGKPLRDFILESDRRALEGLLASKEAGRAEVRLRLPVGESLPALVTMTQLDGRKLLLFSDTSLRRRHEASDELTRKFLGMLAHEFRNILAPIKHSVHYLKQVESLDTTSRKAVETIDRHAERMAGLVEDLTRINPKE